MEQSRNRFPKCGRPFNIVIQSLGDWSDKPERADTTPAGAVKPRSRAFNWSQPRQGRHNWRCVAPVGASRLIFIQFRGLTAPAEVVPTGHTPKVGRGRRSCAKGVVRSLFRDCSYVVSTLQSGISQHSSLCCARSRLGYRGEIRGCSKTGGCNQCRKYPDSD